MDNNSVGHTKWECKPAKQCQNKNYNKGTKKGRTNKGTFMNIKITASKPLLFCIIDA